MQVQQQALERVRGCRLDPAAIAAIYERMLVDTLTFGVQATEITLDWSRPEDPIQEGDMVPVMILALRPVIKESEDDRPPMDIPQ